MDRRKFTEVISLISMGVLAGCSTRRVYYPGTGKTYSGSSTYGESRIMSYGSCTSGQMAGYLNSNNSRARYESVDYIARLYIREAMAEGVNHDIAFAQMCHETKFLMFGNQVNHWQHNYCGLGATDDGKRGLSFPDAATGIRAHIQHLKAYASTSPLNYRLVDPRFRYVKRGSAPTIDHLAGTWASDRRYAQHLRRHLSGMKGRIS